MDRPMNEFGEIKNATDQIEAYAEEIAACVNKFADKVFTPEQAIKITDMAIREIEAETRWKLYTEFKRFNQTLSDVDIDLDQVTTAISEKSDHIEKIEEDFRELMRCMCTMDAHNKIVCHPTINVIKEDKA